MGLWKKIATLGVTDDMSISKQKSTIFFNIIMRLALIVLILLATTMHFFLHLFYVPIGIFLAIPIIALSLFLNLKGKVNFSVFLTALIFPIYFTFLSVYAKSNGEGLTLIYSLVPRFGIIIMSSISFAVLGFGESKKAFAGAAFGVLILILFNPIHKLFGIDIVNLELRREDIYILIVGLIGIFIFVVALTSILHKISKDYERIVTKQRDLLIDKNTEITAQKEEIEQQNIEIEAQKNYLYEKNKKIEYQNKQITDSIKYASYIQKSVLPKQEEINNVFDSFIFYQPRDIVSGDFYWVKNIEQKYYLAAADCTGHGVPGAFVSLLGISFLNSILIEKKITSTDYILNELRKMIKDSLHQQNLNSQQKEGMDISLFVINIDTKELEFSGAQNPLYLIRKKLNKSKIEELKANKKVRIFENESEYSLVEFLPDRMPIGVYINEKPFSKKNFVLNKGDLLYAFSDGFVDQYSENGKYMSKHFKDFLVSNAEKNLNSQMNLLETEFNNWRGDYEQTDDVIVMCVKI